jgi:hypothetical protein
MKKSLLATVIMGTLALTACGESEKSDDAVFKKEVKKEVVKPEDSEKALVADSEKGNVKLPMVKTELKKLGTDKSFLLKKDLLTQSSTSKEKVKKEMLEFKESGLSFTPLMKDEFDALKGIEKEGYELKLKNYRSTLSVLEIYLSDKYEGTKKQSFYFSESSLASEVGYFEVQFDDMSKEDMFIIKSEDKWVVFETKVEKEAREKKLKAFLESSKAKIKKSADKK